MKIINKEIPVEMKSLIERISEIYCDDPKIANMFKAGFKNTYQTTIQKLENGDSFVITGDIPAMWNRDSAAQVRPLLNIVNESLEIDAIIRGVISIHTKQVQLDPYANAHNLTPQVGDHSEDDLTEVNPMVWERKYEVDSLCYPIQLAYLYWKKTNKSDIFNEEFLNMAKVIIQTFITEQNHIEESPYSFRRIADWLLFDEPERIKYETLRCQGKGTPVTYTGMTWSGFRPSDDACQLGYLIPANMFAVVVLQYLQEIFNEFYSEQKNLLESIITLEKQIDDGIKKYGIVEHPKYGKIYAYEVDGFGNYNLMDDANVPSLLSAPYLGYCEMDDPIYLNTRKFILSKDNPFYFQGKYGSGVGSPHTPPNYFWHIALAIEGMTTQNQEERERIFKQFKSTDAGTNFMHEGINVDDPKIYTRPWFSWANSMFAEFILEMNDIKVIDFE